MLLRFTKCVVLAVAGITTTLSAQTPLSHEFTYQGQLRANGLPAITTADFQFALFDAATAGTQISATLTKNNIALSNGTFTVTLNFGSFAFQGDARWLEITVRSPAGVGGFTTLSPRQPLTAAPHSSFSLNTRGIAVGPTGNVGIGTDSPNEKLAVAGDMDLGTTVGEYRHLQVSTGNFRGYLFGADHNSSTGLHLGHNYFIDELGNDQIQHPGGTSRISLSFGSIALATSGSTNLAPENQVVIDGDGAVFQTAVGINRANPQAPLHVNGLVRLDADNPDSSLKVYDESNNQQIWLFGKSFLGQPVLVLISQVTGDLLAGFYRDHESGNGTMFADDKNFRAPNPADASTDIWYCCPEGPEAAMYVRGTGRLVNGRATIELPDHFRNLASEPGMTIQLTPASSDSRGLAFTKKSLNGIDVVELGGGLGNYEFDWRVEAVRKGWENYKVVRPWMQSDKDLEKAWQNRLKWIEERRAHGKPSPDTNAATPRPQN